MNANRRLQERKQPEPMVFCKLGGEESGSVLNLSEDGLCFESLSPIEEKDLLQLRLSVDLNSAIEAVGQLAWSDSAKRRGGLRFLELSGPAREQIHAWLSETSTPSTASSGRNDAPTEEPVIWQEMSVPGMQLVPIERYLAQTRWQFLRGVLVGFGICAVVMIPIFRYAGGTKLGSPMRATAGAIRAAQSSAEQIQASLEQPVSRSALISGPTVTKPPAMPAVSVAAPTGWAQRQDLQRAGAFSTDLMTRTSSPSPTKQPAKAEPLGASSATVVPAPDGSKARFSFGQVQRGKKVPETPEQLWSALQAGNMKAAVTLADLYTRGEGVMVNCEQARILLLVASEKNNAEAQKKLQELDKGGCPQAGSEPNP